MKDRISRLRTALTVWCPFFGHLALKMKVHIVDDSHPVKTAGVTRDRQMFLNESFCASLSDKQLVGLICHEVLHPAFLCFERQGGRTAMVMSEAGSIVSLWNVAHDYCINAMIKDFRCKEIELPPHGLLDSKYSNWSAEEVYDHILTELADNPDGRISIPGEGDGAWGSDDMRPELGEPSQTEAEKSSQESFWKVAVVEAAQVHEEQEGQGTLPGGVQQLVDSITDPKIAWTDVLSRWVGEHGRDSHFSYSRPGRRSESVGEFLPWRQRHGVDDIVVFWDTSGSMCGEEERILSEVTGICEDIGMSLRVICCDSAIHSDQHDVREPEDVDVKGGGGSNFTPAFTLLDEEGYTGVVVAFTDGYITVPDLKPPRMKDCLWVIGPEDVDPTRGKWGEVLQVDEQGNAA